MRLSIRYWLRRWLVPELEPLSQASSDADAEFWRELEQEIKAGGLGAESQVGAVIWLDVLPKGRLH